MALPALVTRVVATLTGSLPLAFLDESGSGSGPFHAVQAIADETGKPLGKSNPLTTDPVVAVSPVQSYKPVAPFLPGDKSNPDGSNATFVLVLAANPNAKYREIVNNGTSDIELWFGVTPAENQVGQALKRGVVLAAGDGRVWDLKVPVGNIYATAAVATGLSVLEG